MEIIISLLTLEVGASILMLGALALILRSFRLYLKKSSELQPKLAKVDKELTRLRETIGPKKKTINELNKAISPLREKEQEFDAFFQALRQTELDQEKEEVAEERETSAAKKRNLQRRSMGFGADGN